MNRFISHPATEVRLTPQPRRARYGSFVGLLLGVSAACEVGQRVDGPPQALWDGGAVDGGQAASGIAPWEGGPSAPVADSGTLVIGADAHATHPDGGIALPDSGTRPDGDPGNDGGMPLARTCIFGPSPSAGIAVWTGPQGQATFSVQTPDACHRRFSLTTTATLREASAPTTRVIEEPLGGPTLRTGHPYFDALHALAIWELQLLSVDSISDGAFASGQPVACGGCFETGALWNYVWTRDAAYAADLATAALAPQRTRATLAFKVSERRGGGAPQIVQDTGTGGGYPVSTDRVAWALGADAVFHHLPVEEAHEFRAQFYPALRNTVEQDRRVAFDAQLGLYRGETSFLDWREQTYPEWTADDVVHIAASKSLSTNLLHLRALEIAARWSLSEAPSEQARFRAWADALRTSIQNQFWLPELGQFSAYRMNDLDPGAVRRFDLLGTALAITTDVATVAQARQMLSGYPLYGPGAPVIWPQQQHTPIYHNRGEWPFVTAYGLRAAAKAGHQTLAEHLVYALVRGAAMNLSHMENFEAASGAVYLPDGAASGPVVNSERQLWSVAGYLSMVHHTIFGLQAEAAGLLVRPFVTAAMRNRFFPDAPFIVLNDYPWRGKSISVVLHFPSPTDENATYRVVSRQLNGSTFTGELVPEAELVLANRLDVFLAPEPSPSAAAASSLRRVSDSDWREVYGPQTPRLAYVREVEGGSAVELGLERGAEEADFVEWLVFRDGAPIAEGLSGAQSSFLDDARDPLEAPAPCYTVMLRYRESGNTSQPSPSLCFWGGQGERVQIIPAATLVADGGTFSNEYGKGHYQGWGDAGHRLELPSFRPAFSGPHGLQAVFGNGAGAISTGITCAVKHVAVWDVQRDEIVGEGYWVMPHLGRWDRWEDSNLVTVSLEAGRAYRIVVDTDPYAINMSAFAHFEAYTAGEGGSAGAFQRVNIAELKILAR